MSSLNKVLIIGNLGKDPETRYAPSGDAICNLTIATSESWKDKATGEKKESTEWHRVVFFGKVAEIANQHLRKGSKIYVEGSLRTRKWQDNNGQDRYTTEIRGDQLKMLGGKQDGDDAGRSQQGKSYNTGPENAATVQRQNSGGGGLADFSDDIPFAPFAARRVALAI